ncbi:killer cell lectin-like receptor subfamily B member 1B allele A [Myripristis murdjan]|uniref:killer cell lectin-like receptor subfamily B member 1B allele A n=1 Tax=Myripristis murdjan TaxID=586833 RepID=UPI001175D9BB|nr:killer cell lectin-like receptor subfamily B member 1B allele A [Myripristis murdjan]
MEGELNYASIVFKANKPSAYKAKREEETVYDDVKVQGNTADLNTDTQEFLGEKPVRGRHGVQLVACCLGILCVVLVTAIVTLCLYFPAARNDSDAKVVQKLKENNLTSIINNLSSTIMNLKNNISNQTALIERRHNPCQEGWLLSPSNSSCYLVITTNNFNEWKTWEEAGEDCRQRNADLVVIENQQEQEFIQEIGDGPSDSTLYSYWIGLRRTSGVWKWVDGSDLTENYWIYQPLDDTDCAVSVQWSSPKGWIDEKCADKNQWICEMKALSV